MAPWHVAPTWLPAARLEVSVHACPPRALADLRGVFPSLPLGVSAADVLILPIFQPTQHDMVRVGDDVDRERDALLEHGRWLARAQFVAWAHDLCARIAAEGFWADFTDPCSGYPMLSEAGGQVYPDVVGAQMLLRYDTVDAGCCRVLLHPRWQSRCYPATVFTTADVATVRRLLGVDDAAPAA